MRGPNGERRPRDPIARGDTRCKDSYRGARGGTGGETGWQGQRRACQSRQHDPGGTLGTGKDGGTGTVDLILPSGVGKKWDLISYGVIAPRHCR